MLCWVLGFEFDLQNLHKEVIFLKLKPFNAHGSLIPGSDQIPVSDHTAEWGWEI